MVWYCDLIVEVVLLRLDGMILLLVACCILYLHYVLLIVSLLDVFDTMHVANCGFSNGTVVLSVCNISGHVFYYLL
jgi:hypothetical protein